MPLIDFEVTHRDRYADGREFGEVGPYVVERGVATYAVDPAGPDGDAIVDLRLAPVDDDGRVVFTGDVRLIRPFITERAGGVGVVDVVNRGNPMIERFLNRSDRVPGEVGDPEPGDGFVFERGWTIMDVGWQTDLIDHPALHGLRAPLAIDHDGTELESPVTVEFSPPIARSTVRLAVPGHTSRPPIDVEDPDAILLVAHHQHGPWSMIPRGNWAFAREADGELTPSPRHLHLADGFRVGRFYSITYRTAETPVGGVGLLAVRDAARWLRRAPGVGRVVGFGVSQTARFLRHLCWSGLNEADAFDGLFMHVAGARRGEFNNRQGSPGALFRPSLATIEPYGSELFDPLRARGVMPKIMLTNTSTEYWRNDASLIHTDLAGITDRPPDPDIRIYHHVGTQHVPTGLPQTNTDPSIGLTAAYGFNVTDDRVLLRAEMVALVDWIVSGETPPPNAHPTIGDGSLSERSTVLSTLHGHDVAGFDPDSLPVNGPYDLGPEHEQGIVEHPVQPSTGERYRSLVPAVGDDGNERTDECAGVALPSVTMPVGIHSGWNVRAEHRSLAPTRGLTRFFGPDQLGDRYGTRGRYVELVTALADELVAERRLLAIDRDLAVADAAAQWDAAHD